MSQIRLLTVGRPRDRRMADLTEEYLKRLRPWGMVGDTVAEEPFKKGQEAQAVAREQDRMLARLGDQDWVVLLDIQGEMVSSEGLSDRIVRWRNQPRPLVFVIGGSLGVGERIRARADWRWSLSRLTFPHGLAHVLVAEQIYRAWTISQGHPYHK